MLTGQDGEAASQPRPIKRRCMCEEWRDGLTRVREQLEELPWRTTEIETHYQNNTHAL